MTFSKFIPPSVWRNPRVPGGASIPIPLVRPVSEEWRFNFVGEKTDVIVNQITNKHCEIVKDIVTFQSDMDLDIETERLGAIE